MTSINRTLLRIVGMGWVCFMVAGVIISQVFAAPTVTLLVDRSYCDAADWQRVTTQYDALYRQNQQGRVEIERLVLFSDLGEEVLDEPLSPEDFQTLSTYGKANPDRQQTLKAEYANAQLLSCGQ
ncbi:MAG: hypothetical protein AAF215_09215 [Cyanobacteria bacterium P01_A01_bin.123]